MFALRSWRAVGRCLAKPVSRCARGSAGGANIVSRPEGTRPRIAKRVHLLATHGLCHSLRIAGLEISVVDLNPVQPPLTGAYLSNMVTSTWQMHETLDAEVLGLQLPGSRVFLHGCGRVVSASVLSR